MKIFQLALLQTESPADEQTLSLLGRAGDTRGSKPRLEQPLIQQRWAGAGMEQSGVWHPGCPAGPAGSAQDTAQAVITQSLQRLTGQAPWPAGRQVLEQPLHSKQMWDVEAAGRQRGAALWNRALEHVLLSSAGQAVPKDSSTSGELLAQSGTALVCIHGTSVSTIC